jgi:hypothetical protein
VGKIIWIQRCQRVRTCQGKYEDLVIGGYARHGTSYIYKPSVQAEIMKYAMGLEQSTSDSKRSTE